jgi:hypothetical protein
MPSLATHQSNEYTKLLAIGDSKSGKTGSLVSLVKAGYKLRILDFDNGLDVLKQFVLRDCPQNLGNIEYRTLRDNYKATEEGPVIEGKATAFINALKMLDRWVYDDIDYGDPAEWGPDVILVIDSFTFMSDAAFAFREPLTPKGKMGTYDKRAVYGDSQNQLEKVLAALTSGNFKTNVIVISHVRYVDNPDGMKKGYPSSVGAALSPTIPAYFNNVVRYANIGGRRQIETISSPMFDLATAKPFEMPNKLPIETGLADIFTTLRAKPALPKLTVPSKLRRI